MWKVAPELTINHSMVVQHLKQIVKLRKLNKWVPHERTQNWKNCRSEVSSLILHKNEPFLNRIVRCNKKWIVYDNQWWPAQRLDWEVPKHFPKPNLHQKKVTWWSSASLTHYSFLNPSETITSGKYAQQIDEMHQKLQSLQPTLVNKKGPILLHDHAQPPDNNQCFKSWTNRAMRFCLILHIHLTSRQLTTTSSTILTTFCREHASRTSRILSKSSLNPRGQIFML